VVKLEKQFQKLDESIKGAKRILITAHKYPDGDALGSVLALHHALKAKNKLVSTPYFSDPLPSFKFLPGFGEIKTKFSPKNIDLLLGLDYGDFKRLGREFNNFSTEKVITIDHHLPSDHRGILQIVRPDFSSTSEILHCFFKKAGIAINKDIATCLLTGIYTDSGGFKHAVTSSRTLKAAADLISCGASLSQIIKETTLLKSPSVLRLWGKALSRIERDLKTGMVYSLITANDLRGKNSEDLGMGDLAAVISMISGAPFTLLLTEHKPNEFRGSLRSEFYHNIDVSKIAKVFGGGGHKLSAGFEKKGSLDEILEQIKKAPGVRREIA